MEKNSKSSNNLIIGGGIAGLLYSFYNPSYIVITDKVGGQFLAPFQLGPRYLSRTKETEKFMQDIDAIDKVKTKKIRVGFYYSNKVNLHNTEENRKQYFYKTRGLKESEVYHSAMSERNETFEVFDISVEDLIGEVYERVRNNVIIDKIKSVDLFFKVTVGKKHEYSFDNLVVTVPKPVFCSMIGQIEEAKQFQSFPTTFIKTERLPINIEYTVEDFRNYDYVYFSQLDYLFHRITRIPGGYCTEFRGDNIPSQEYEVDRFVLKVGQLIQRNDTIVYPSYIQFFGRYAEWKHSIKTKELLEKLLK